MYVFTCVRVYRFCAPCRLQPDRRARISPVIPSSSVINSIRNSKAAYTERSKDKPLAVRKKTRGRVHALQSRNSMRIKRRGNMSSCFKKQVWTGEALWKMVYVEDILIAAFANVRTLVDAFRECNRVQREIFWSFFIGTRHVEITRFYLLYICLWKKREKYLNNRVFVTLTSHDIWAL